MKGFPYRETLFHACLLRICITTRLTISLSGRAFLHFVPAKLHFVKKTFRLIENLLWYKYSR